MNFKQLQGKDWASIFGTLALFFGFLYFKPSLEIAFNGILKPFTSIFEAICGFLFISVLLGKLSNKSFFYDIKKAVVKSINASEDVVNVGLSGVHRRFDDIPFKDLINGTKQQIDIISIYSSSWLKIHQMELTEFLSKKKHSITLILTEPGSHFAKSSEEKFHTTGETRKLDDSILKTVEFLKNQFRPCKGKFKIYFCRLPFSFSYYKFDTSVVVIPYKHSPKREMIPAFLFEKTENENDLYKFYTEDFLEVCNHEFTSLEWINENN